MWTTPYEMCMRRPKHNGLPIGPVLTSAVLVALPVGGTSVNPARSSAVAFLNGDATPCQLSLICVARLGELIAGATFHIIAGEDRSAIGSDRSTEDVRQRGGLLGRTAGA